MSAGCPISCPTGISVRFNPLTGVRTPASVLYMETTAVVTNVFAEESHLSERKLLVTVVYSDGTTTEKHLSGSVARRYLRTMRAKVA